MDKYLFDTSSISELYHFYESRFVSLWDQFDLLVNEGRINSIKEVKRELEALNRKSKIDKRENLKRDFYVELTLNDFNSVKEILAIKGNQELVHRKSINKGTPCADPFLVAKAENENYVIVTEEKYVEKAINLPSVCKSRGVRCINLEQFMIEQKWTF